MERRRGTPLRLFWVGQDMEEPEVPEGRKYDEEGGGTTPPPSATHARVAPQTRSTIAVEERPLEAMPLPDAGANRRWANVHINRITAIAPP